MLKTSLVVTQGQVDAILAKLGTGEVCSVLKAMDDTSGCINRVFSVTSSSGREYVLKLINQGHSRTKTLNEVSVLRFLKKNAPHVPVPQVYLYESCKETSLVPNTEYILMAKAKGTELEKIYIDMPIEKKKFVLKQVAEILTELQQFEFSSIGSFVYDEASNQLHTVPLCYYYKDAKGTQTQMGPFSTLEQYIVAILKQEILAIKFKMETLSEDQMDQEEREALKEHTLKFEALIDKIIPSWLEKANSKFVLTHSDLNISNFLCDDEGHITALLDWEWARSFPQVHELSSGIMEFFVPEEQCIELSDYLFHLLASHGSEVVQARHFIPFHNGSDFTKSYYKTVNAVIIVYDVCKEESFNNLEQWFASVDTYAPAVKKILVGNKCDLEELRVVSTTRAQEFAKMKGVKLIETSAKQGSHVGDVFTQIVVELSS